MLNHKSGNIKGEHLLKLGAASIYKVLHSKIRHSKILARYVRLFSVLSLLFTSTVINAVDLPFNSSTGPTLLSGGGSHLTVGAKYIYQNIATSTDGVLVDAIVTIADLNGAVIGDDALPFASRTIDTIIETDDRFEPLLNLDTLGVDGYIEWQIVFVQDGTVTNATDVGRRAYLDAFTLEAIDVDFTEYFEVIVSNSYTLEAGGPGSPATELVVSTNGQYTKFQSPASPGANNINITDTEFIVRINYQNVNEIRFRNGYIGNNTNRQNSLSFFGEVTFGSEDTTVVNVPPTVVDNPGNVSDIDATFNINLLTGASDSDGNLVASTIALIDPNDATNLGVVGSSLVIPTVGTYTVTATGALSFVPVSGYAGPADILFTVSDALNVSSDRGTLGLTIADIADPVVTINAIPTAFSGNEANYPVSGTCTTGDGNVTVSIVGVAPPIMTPCNAGSWGPVNFNVSGIGDGTGVIMANANQTNGAGSTGNATQVVANKDTVVANPACVFTPASATTGSVPVSVTCTGVESGASLSIGTLSCDLESGGAKNSITCTGTASDVGNNPDIDITDSVGNTNTDTGVFTFDGVAPVVTLNAIPNVNAAFDETSYPVSGTCTAGDGNVLITVAGATPNPASATCLANGTFATTVNTSGIGEGVGAIVANARQTDLAGNLTNATPVTANKDTVIANPTCVFTPPSATTGSTPISVMCTGVEPGSSISIGGLSCSAESAGSITCTGTAGSAGNNPPIIITDPVGNTNTGTGAFTFDGVAPVVAITNAPTATAANANNYPVSGTCTTGDGDVTVNIAGVTPAQTVACVAGNWGSVIFDVSGLPDGAGVVDINASQTDGAGNRGNAPLVEVDKVPAMDTDNDGITDSLDLDDDNDGIPDSVEIAGAVNGGDTDGDGIPDERDLDADGDGISDIVESGLSATQILALDTDGDGSIDEPVGANGLADAIENVDNPSAVITYNGGAPLDTDGDGRFDFQDLDSDNDSIHDLAESGLDLAVFDANNDGVLDNNATDADQDGLPDSLDNNDAAFGGINSNPLDTDGDTVADFRDLDSDNDGIHDLVESGILIPAVVDTDNDGVLDNPTTDSDNDGIPDSGDSDDAAYGDPQSIAIVNTDGHDVPDYRDLDSDNDSINDIVESGNGAADTDGDGVADNPATDSDGDGVPDSIDASVNTFGDPDITPLPDADGDGTPDAQEVDSDKDGTNDIVDNGFGGLDTNGDGRIDAVADSDGDGIPDVIDGSNGFGDAPDLDRDGIADINDIDVDNDGIPDTVEQATAINGGDTDGDGVPDNRDLDADGDGISDIVESGLTPAQIIAFDGNSDGVIDATIPVGVNGLADAIETDDTITALLDQDGDGSANGPVDTDNDLRPDFQDLDADNDGIHDLIEVGGLHPDPLVIDANNDGVIDDNGTDADQDGIPDSIDTNDALPGGLSSSPVDTDGDSVANFRDIDSDSDGITDLYESGIFPDTTVVDADNNGVLDNPTTDADGDGIPDSGDSNDGTYGDPQGTSVVDTDNDNVPDYLDLDSDNDSIPDVIEAGNQDDNGDGLLDPGGTVTFPPIDTAPTDTPDFRNPDSNNDGTNDIEDAGNDGFDTDGDGRVDGSDDADEDGVLDPVDGEPNGFGFDGDNDGDGIPNSVDLDDDNDGIPDIAEKDANGNDVDTDGDGIVDRLDLDSDNDGIPDSVEATTSVLDADADGVIDNFIDANNDGLDDRVSPTLIPVDTDGDGTPDFRDLDSDNDGLTDLYEANGFTNAGDSDGDGMLDDLTDLDKDGLADVVDPDVTGGTAGTRLPNPDTDGDGISNYRDVDSDNDGISDGDENVDADGDGILDNLQNANLQNDDERLETAVNGIGSFGLLNILLLFVPVLLRSRKLFSGLRVTLLFALMLPTFSVMAETNYWSQSVFSKNTGTNYCGRHNPLNSDAGEDFKKCFYIGAGYLFATHVHPRGEAKTWKTSDDSDAGYNIYLGWHFKPRWFGELSYADLGDAGLSRTAPSSADGEISYKIPSVHIGYWFFKPERRFNIYAKAGLSFIQNKETPSEIPFEKQNNVNLTGGIGVQWRSQTSGLFARLAADFYDRDAASVGINVGYYFGGSHKHKIKNVHTPVAPLMIDQADNVDTDGDGVINERDLCPNSAIGAIVDGSGCAIPALSVIPDLSLRGVNFRTNSAIITGQSKAILDNAAAALISVPHVNVEVQAHTDNLGDADYNDDLSYRRALAVRHYLERKGVSKERMEVQGYGERQPAFTNSTRMGRWQNRRVELLIID